MEIIESHCLTLQFAENTVSILGLSFIPVLYISRGEGFCAGAEGY